MTIILSIIREDFVPRADPGNCKIGPIRFQARWSKNPLKNQALISVGLISAYLVVFLHGCLGFCVVLDSNYAQFCMGVLHQSRDWLARPSLKRPVTCQAGRLTLLNSTYKVWQTRVSMLTHPLLAVRTGRKGKVMHGWREGE